MNLPINLLILRKAALFFDLWFTTYKNKIQLYSSIVILNILIRKEHLLILKLLK
jgi:hypothetical protein